MFFKKSPEQKKKELARWLKSLKTDTVINIENLEDITRLDLSFKQIDKLPKQIDCLVNLEILNISYNKIIELPWEIRNLKKLKSLDLGYNKLKDVPGVVCQLEQLEFLNLEANQLKKVASVIGNLKKLKELNLFANQIIDLPSEFGQLTKVTRLNLALNQLNTLPDSFSKLYNISVLELWLNKFDLIPDVISQLPNLTDLYSVVDPDKLNKTLIWSVIGDNTYLADKLIFYGADVNYMYEEFANHHFTTPLFEAKSFDMITLLLTMGADPDLKREIVKHVHTKNGEETRPTGQFETFLTKKHPKEIQKFIKNYLATQELLKKTHSTKK